MSISVLRSICLTAGLGLASLTCGAETTVHGLPSGVISAPLGVGLHPLAFPLVQGECFSGIIASNSGASVHFAAGDVAAALENGAAYYLEVVAGPLEGERLDVNTSATLAAGGSEVILTLGPGSLSTADTLNADVLASARAVIRRHVTLGSLPALFSPALEGNNSAAKADSVQLLVNGLLTTFYLRGDGVTWREVGKTVDESARVVAPDTALLVQLRSGAKRWLLTGGVRSNVFLVPLTPGARAFATGFPLDLSPRAIGAAVDPAAPAEVRWTGSDTVAAADTLKVFDESTGAFVTYYLRADGVSWYASTGGPDVSGQNLINATGMTVLTRIKPDRDYLIIPPFNL